MTNPIEEAENPLGQVTPESEALQIIPEAMARKHMVIPLSQSGNILRVAMANPTDIFALEALASWSQMRIEPEEELPTQTAGRLTSSSSGSSLNRARSRFTSR